MANPTNVQVPATGIAALAICESLLLALSDLKIIGERETRGLLEDAAAAFRNGGASTQTTAIKLEVVAILERIIAGRNAVPPV